MPTTSKVPSESAPPPRWTADEVRRRLASFSLGEASSTPDWRRELRQRYQEAAAVRYAFDPAAIDLPGPSVVPASEKPPAAAELLLEDVTLVRRRGAEKPAAPLYVLRPAVRGAALQRAIESGRLAAILEKTSLPSDDLPGRLLHRYLNHDPPLIAEQSADELAATLKVLRWLEAGGAAEIGHLELPPSEDVRRELTARRLIETFRYLAGEHFYGRRDELAELREYVGVLPPQSAGRALWRGVRNILGWEEKPPLMVHGPGGVGKSTLLARFVLEHFESGEKGRFPFVYIDFDRPDVSVTDPLGLLAEAVRQLAAQLPEPTNTEMSFRELRNMLIDYRDSYRLEQFVDEDVTSPESAPAGEIIGKSLADTLERFAAVFRASAGDERPLVLLLDTFEEAQYESRPLLELFWEFLRQFQSRLPKLRVILAGRAPETTLRIESLPLGNLDDDAASSFLAALGQDDPEVQHALVRQLRGNPLTLRLAHEVVRREGAGASGVRDLRTRAWLLRVEQGVIQGMLYTRILGHIRHPDAARLAHPGLVLRVVDPELILEVLAQPCGLSISSRTEAEELFDELARETALVSFTEEGGLRMRSDLRRTILPLVRQDQSELVEKIHRRAVRYYRAFDDPPRRAEEVYHRLCLGQTKRTLDGRFMDGLRPFLVSSLEELPAPGQIYLATRFEDLDLPPEIWREAEQEDWERHALATGRRWLKQERHREVLKLLKERPRDEWLPDSALPALEAEALIAAGQARRARERLEAELEATRGQPRPRYRFELFLLLAHVQRQEDEPEAAGESLRQATELAADLDSKELLRAELASLEALDRSGRRDSADFTRQLERARQAVEKMSDAQLAKTPSLMRRAGAHLGRQYPEFLARLVSLDALPALEEDDRKNLGVSIGDLLQSSSDAPVQKNLQKLDQILESQGSGRRINRELSKILQRPQGLEELDSFQSLVVNLTDKLDVG